MLSFYLDLRYNVMMNVVSERIEGDRIAMRMISRADTPLVVKWRNNPRVRKCFVYREVFTDESHEKWLADYVDTGRVEQFVMLEKNRDLRPVGSVYFRNIDREEQSAEYGIFIGEDDAVGLGYGSEATRLAVTYARDVMGLKKLGLRVFSDNEAAVKSYISAGFKAVRTLKDVECSDGEIKDMIWMETSL